MAMMRASHAVKAFGYGVLAYIVGYVATLAMVMWRHGGEPIGEVLTLTAWAFHSAQFVGVSANAPRLFADAHNVASDPDIGLPVAVVYTIPVVVLMVVGFLHARNAMGHHNYKRHGRRIGAQIVIGYGVTAVFVSLWSIREIPVLFGSANAGPDLGMTVLFMGLIYPVILGGIGGWLYQGAAKEGWFE